MHMTLVRSLLRPKNLAFVLILLALGAGCGQPAMRSGQGPSIVAEPGAFTLANAVVGQDRPSLPVPATFDVAALAERVKPAVVSITTTQEMRLPGGGEGDPFDYFFGPRMRQMPEHSMKRSALGSGFIIDSSGYVVTNEHVVHDADEVQVHLADDRDLPAEVVGRDSKLDLALLRIKGVSGLPVVVLGSSEQTRVGESVLAVGNPFGLGHTVTLGIVSAKARTIGAGPYDDFIQTDASINPGNSGGPLFNWKGEVVGINTAIKAGASGIGFAIPSDALRDVLPQLRDKGYVERGKLGVAFQPVTPQLAKGLRLVSSHGALVAELEPNGAAARAGVQLRDVIVAVDGVPIRHAEELPRNVARHAPGTQLPLTLERGNTRIDVSVKLDVLQDDEAHAIRPPHALDGGQKAQPAGRFGLVVSDVPGGARIDKVVDANQNEELHPGDVIVEVDGAPVRNSAELSVALAKAKPGSTVLARVRRGPTVRYAAIPVPEK